MVNRRIGKENSETRQTLLDAAEAMMRERGHAAVTSRALAQYANLKPQLVHYYFRTMDELFEELFRTTAERHLSDVKEAAHAEKPLARLFEVSCDISAAVLSVEFLALANKHKGVHALVMQFGMELNAVSADIIARTVDSKVLELSNLSPEQAASIIQSFATGMAFAGRFDGAYGNRLRAVVIRWFENVDRGGKKLLELARSQF